MTVQPIKPQDHQPPARRQTASSRKRQQAAMDAQTVVIRVEGVEYTLNPNDITGAVEYRIRKEIGMGLEELSGKLEASPGVDYLGMFLWACRLAGGETDLDLMEVLEGISHGSDVEVVAGDVKVPKASAKSS